MKPFTSCFSEHLVGYIRLKRGLGLRFDTQADTLWSFDKYVHEHAYDGLLTQELALDFASSNPDVTLKSVARRYNDVRNFADYLATYEPRTPRLDPKALRCPRTRPPAYIYTREEIGRLVREARNVSLKNPMRGITLRAMVGLAASTGMRVSEVVRLDKSDVDLDTGMVSIRQTKFYKDRLVPVHHTTLDELRNYASARDAFFVGCDCPAFFITMWRTRFSKHTLSLAFVSHAKQMGVKTTSGCNPRFHDLRHTFAVTRMVEWYKSGEDLKDLLPSLATYMGHVHYSDTAYYISATAELLGLAAERYHNWLRAWEVHDET